MGGVTDLFAPSVVAKGAINTFKNRAVQGRTIGNPAQLGATAVIAPGGELVWRHLAKDPSDNVTPDEILQAAGGRR